MEVQTLKANRKQAMRRLLTAPRETLLNPERRRRLAGRVEELEQAIASAEQTRPLAGPHSSC